MSNIESAIERWNQEALEIELDDSEAEFNEFIKRAVNLTKSSLEIIHTNGDRLEGWQHFFPSILDAIYGFDGFVARGSRLERFSYLIYHLTSRLPLEARENIKAGFMPNDEGSIKEVVMGRERRFQSLEQWRNFTASNESYPIPEVEGFQSELEIAARDLRIPLA